MKRKILSLALALMMIVSVAAAMPVSAAVGDITYLSVTDDGFDPKGGESTAAVTVVTDQAVKGGDAQSWAGTTLSKVTTVKKNISWTFDVPETGLYNIYIAASTNAGHRIDVTANGTKIANYMEINVDSVGNADTASGAFQLYPTETLIAKSIAFTNGADNVLNVSHAGGGSKTIAVYKVKLELVVSESELEPGAIRITDDIGNVLSNIETGSPVMAVVALDKSVEGVNIFFVQYAGSGDTRRMVDYTFTRAGSSIVGSTGEYNYYRVMTTVAADVTEIKAFVWTTDDKYVPLCDAVAVQ